MRISLLKENLLLSSNLIFLQALPQIYQMDLIGLELSYWNNTKQGKARKCALEQLKSFKQMVVLNETKRIVVWFFLALLKLQENVSMNRQWKVFVKRETKLCISTLMLSRRLQWLQQESLLNFHKVLTPQNVLKHLKQSIRLSYLKKLEIINNYRKDLLLQ